MLLLSLVIHASLAAAIAFSYFHGEGGPVLATSEAITPPATVFVLRSVETLGFQNRQTYSVKLAARSSATPMISPVALLSTAQPPVVNAPLDSMALPTAALALEANPNAHVRSFPSDAILSPNPAPQLNAADGVVFILDVSGSMYEPYAGSTRLALARQSLGRRILALKDGTPFAIILYAQRAHKSGPLVAANDATREAAVGFIARDVDLGGGTNLAAGLASAQELHPGALVLASDGDLNIAAYDLAAEVRSILGQQGQGPHLTVVGIAPRASEDAERLLQSLAKERSGPYLTERLAGDAELVISSSNGIKPDPTTR